MDPRQTDLSSCGRKRGFRVLKSSRPGIFALAGLLITCAILSGCTQPVTFAGSLAMPTISSFTASPSTVASGAAATLNWVTTGATSIVITPGSFASESASGSMGVNPTATTTYTLTASNSSGSVTATVTVNVSSGAGNLPVINSFAASPTSIVSGTSSVLSWSVTGATSVAISPGNFTSTSASGTESVSPTATTTYTLTATNSAGSTTASVTVSILTLPIINSFTASPATIGTGGSSTLGWSTTGAASVAITPGSFTSVAASGTTSVSPAATTTYTLTATNTAGSVTATVTVTVSSSLPSITSFTANPTSIASGASSTLSWATSGATSVAITPGTFTSTAASGSTSVSPTTTTTYTLTATNGAGSTTATVTVTVVGKPVINSFLASPATIASGSSSTLSWSTTGATSVAITPGTFTSAAASGSTGVSPTTTTTYTLTATNIAGSTTATVTVTVASLPVINSFTANPASINSGSGSTLSWSTSGATSVAITPGTFTSTAASGSTSVSPTTTTTYTLTATNAVGSVTATATVTVAAIPVISSFTASLTTITSGSSTTLSWATTGATSIAITPGTFTSTSASGSTSVSPTTTTTYTLTATNASGSVTATVTVTVSGSNVPVITSFTASPSTISSGSSSTLTWVTTGSTSIAITPGTFTSTSASGSTSVSPTATTTYTLTATDAAGSVTATAKVTVGSSGGALKITTTTCPGGTQNSAYVGCTITVTGGTPPYTFSINTSGNYPTLPEGMTLNSSTGDVTAPIIGGEGSYIPEINVKDSTGATATADVTFSINGSNAYMSSVFPSTSIFHHRVDAASTGLPVDTSPAAPIYSGYDGETIKPFFGNLNNTPFPNGIPGIEVPYNQPDVAVSTTEYQSYFTSGPIPSYAPIENTALGGGDMHVLVYVEAGGGNNPALYEMWQGIPLAGGNWTDSSNALWPNANSNALTTQGNGTTDAAGLPVTPLLVNADEVIGTGTPTAPNGVVQHPVRFTVNNMLNYWVWPATETAGVGSCAGVSTGSLISQSSPPSSCTMTGPAGEIYRLKASVATPSCAASSPQAAIIITGFRNYGIILADNGQSGGLIGTPDARWNDNDLECLTSLTLADFEPVNVSSLMVSSDSGQTQ